MEIVVIANGIADYNGHPNISGGDVRFLEIMRRWARWGHTLHLLTPPAGVELAKRFGIEARFHPLPITDGAGFRSYAQRVLVSARLPASLQDFRGYVYSSTEHIYDCVPATWLARRGNRWAAVVHLVSPAPWKRRASGLVNATMHYVQEHIGLALVKRHAATVLAVSKATADDYVRIGGNAELIHLVECGIDGAWLAGGEEADTFTYDGVFMGRLHPEKGVFELLDAWAKVVAAVPGVRLAVIGQGSEAIREEMLRRIDRLGITANVDLLGGIYDVERKLAILRSSRMFILPSHGENWGIVIGEAMAAGLPVICFDIPNMRQLWGDTVHWVPFGDTGALADDVLRLRGDAGLRSTMRRRGREFIRRYDWDAIAARELALLAGDRSLAEPGRYPGP